MSELDRTPTRLPEEKTPAKSGFWQKTLKTITGDSTEELIERFTSEMTLVAEGLSEDQARLDRKLDQLCAKQEKLGHDADAERDRLMQRIENEQQVLETTINEERRDRDVRLSALEDRLTALEKQLRAKKEAPKKNTGLVRQLIILASILGGSWIIVTILQLFKQMI